MKQISWDPLLNRQETDVELLAAAQKREIKNILKSYVGMYDSFSELIQNAMDAVDKRGKVLNEKDYQKKLWLTINLAENSFTITDNGIGFKEEEFRTFLAPNISFKDDRTTRGNKGVGATYIGYGFDFLQFGTKGNGHEFVGELAGGRSWVEDYKGVVTRPVVQSSKSCDPAFGEISRGSTFKIKFEGPKARPKDLSWYTATTAEQWEYLLLIRTPLGAIDYLEGSCPAIKFDLKVITKDGESTLEDRVAKYIYPHDKIHASVNLKDILSYQRRLVENGKSAANIPSKYKRMNGMYEYFSTDDLLKLRSLKDNQKSIIEEYNMEAYGYFCCSTEVWDKLNDSIANLRKGYRVLKGGLQLANNNMTQGEMLTIPLSSNIGYQNQCHVIVHFKNADPDLGRKGFQPELKEVAEKLGVGIVNRFKKWKKTILKADTGVKPEIEKEYRLHEWIKEQERHEESNPLSLVSPNFFLPENQISITSEPQSEQDVIVLFNQLIAGGVVRGIKLLATSQSKQYDSVFRFSRKKPFVNHNYDSNENPLGVLGEQVRNEFVSPPKILEYKFNIDALMRNLRTRKKTKRIFISLSPGKWVRLGKKDMM